MASGSNEVVPFSLDNEFDYDNVELTSLEVTSEGYVEKQNGVTWNSLDCKMAKRAREKECKEQKCSLSHLALARTGSATLTARLEQMYTPKHYEAPKEGGKYLDIPGERM